MKYQIFIFNWKNQESTTLSTLQSLKDIGYNPIVINSDESLISKYDWYHLTESAYFSEQFNTALALFNADIFFHIQGDATYDNWFKLIEDSKYYYCKYEYGIYAPNINYTFWTKNIVDEQYIEHNICEVKNTDCTCWFIHKDILSKFTSVDLNINKLGWGIDSQLAKISKSQNRKVLRDYNHTIYHPKHTNYDKKQANEELEKTIEFFKNT